MGGASLGVGGPVGTGKGAARRTGGAPGGGKNNGNGNGNGNGGRKQLPPRQRQQQQQQRRGSGGNNGNGSGSTGMLPGIEAAPIDAAAEAAASGEVLRTVSAGEARLPPVLR